MNEISLDIMGVIYIVAGLNHFKNPKIYKTIMPPYIPFPEFMIFISGVIEVILGAGLLWPVTRILAAWGIIALLIAVLPPHIYMIQNRQQWSRIPAWALWLRLPLQGLLMLWAYSYT